ncbi:glycosyltransferase family 2 protein [Paracidovorax valerianellae]|uniref:Glycosyl transferase family 2 n=1 Tax=Paracidovorax valerianellae TaxID=187868 RepID=A0A1G6VJD9_9BURK|nr:glycosyltransferase family 2 protein [Paracidovorax valerianellae]MDA8447102.1 glycosyltransferase family 2 protein [Paracidovorax valerianellae]SDD53631.1 Glycosyl transferase family 2 [Paracidovorax valerianellae]
MSLPRVSVVMPIYNAEATLQRALDSIRNQTLLPFEVICVDDGSRDGSVCVAERYDPASAFVLRVVKQPRNAGAAAARNRGLDLAAGEIVGFLDADDIWSPDKLERQLEAMLNQDLDLVGGHSGVRAQEMPASVNDGDPAPLDVHVVSLLPAMLSNPFHTSSVIVRRDGRVRFPDNGQLSEDYALWLQLIAAGWRCARHSQPLSFMYKPAFGSSGLSAQLWRMQRGELFALGAVGRRGHRGALALALPVSCLKFGIRLLRTWLR